MPLAVVAFDATRDLDKRQLNEPMTEPATRHDNETNLKSYPLKFWPVGAELCFLPEAQTAGRWECVIKICDAFFVAL